MYLPSSTYRLQFNKEFRLTDLAQIMPYLIRLNPGAVYASPFFSAVPGSNHGYDVTSPLRINPEIGSDREFSQISELLTDKGIGWIQDIVPNHMAFHPENEWLMNALKYGKGSGYANYFDIDWDHPVYKNRVIVPVLDDTTEKLINSGEIKLSITKGDFHFVYGELWFPVNPDSLKTIIDGFTDSQELCAAINNDHELLLDLLNKQHYILTHWHKVEQAINYRRFFTINGLISLNMEDIDVFEGYHKFIIQLIKEKKLQGIRLDHVDGLKKPVEYFNRLRARVGKQTYIVAEKILNGNEKSDPYWPIQGTSGYDFMATLNGLFTGKGITTLLRFYEKLTGTSLTPEELIYQNKLAVLNSSFRGDLDNICRLISDAGLIRFGPAITPENIRDALGELIVCCPVYKLYSDHLPLNQDDQKTLNSIFQIAVANKPLLKFTFSALKKLFFSDNRLQEKATGIFLRMMQYTGPIMAKGVEDTAMYQWAAFIARNEVGDTMSAVPLTIDDFHKAMIERRNTIPASINATATHDTKRGEDTRARLLVLSDIPGEWIRFYNKWASIAEKFKVKIYGKLAPDKNEEYFICQVIVGSLPMDGKPDETFLTRLQNYVRKALREAKIHTNWNSPDLNYENVVLEYMNKLLKDRNLIRGNIDFFVKLRDFGILNSLAQVVLKCTCPGIPDFYQGTELWDFSFVDPDNRRPVNYKERLNLLDNLQKESMEPKSKIYDKLSKSLPDGRLKLWMIHMLMKERFSDPKAFVEGEYLPLRVTGSGSGDILAFLRIHQEKYYAAIVPLHKAARIEKKSYGLHDKIMIHLPVQAPASWIVLWDNRIIRSDQHIINASDLKYGLPVVLKGITPASDRSSGILLHLTSLPGKYGTGSFGEEATEFIDLLKKSGQKYWQILPFNPPGIGYSPYSSPSAFAGNELLIDPVILYKQRRISKLPPEFVSENVSDFKKAKAIRQILFKEVFRNFKNSNDVLLRENFDEFRSENAYWLDDFAVFTSLRKHYGDHWTGWPPAIRNHRKTALRSHRNKFAREIELISFIQFLFHEQFSQLKSVAASFGIKIIGDLPIYVAYNSADVWAHREIFKLDSNGRMLSVAGVPPDFFSTSGQLWKMPVYNWENLKETGYKWWIDRIRRNMEYCDMLRLDHFRALSSFWEVPAQDTSARNGKWIKGPGKDFLAAVELKFGYLPFIAEDLGDIDDEVLQLRDLFKLPGMKVLMFGMDSIPGSFHIPYRHTENSVVYTGTHDNNTVKGWYKQLNASSRNRLDQFLGKKTTASTISWDLICQALNSVSRLSVIPLQDILGLDASSRLNTPARSRGNWKWKLSDYNDFKKVIGKLLNQTYYAGRI